MPYASVYSYSPSLLQLSFPFKKMTGKICTLMLKVDLGCSICSKKIKKALCKLQDRARIQSIVYDEKNSAVIVSGPFDPHCLSKKLCCMACKVIKDIQIMPADDPPPVDGQPPPDHPHTSSAAGEKEQEVLSEPDTETTTTTSTELEAVEVDQPPASTCKVPEELVYLPVHLPVCCSWCRQPQLYHGCCFRCCSGRTRVYGDPPPAYGGSYCPGFKIVCEEEASSICGLM